MDNSRVKGLYYKYFDEPVVLTCNVQLRGSNYIYEGEVNEASKPHGIGLMITDSNNIYYGNFRCGKKEGNGAMIYPNGRIYIGEWLRAQRHGNGTTCNRAGEVISYNRFYKGKKIPNPPSSPLMENLSFSSMPTLLDE